MKKKYQSFDDVLRGLRRLIRKGWKARSNCGVLQLRRPGGRRYCFCPWTAIYFDDSGRGMALIHADADVAVEIGFPRKLVGKIIDTADNELRGADWSEDVTLETFDKARKQLEEACGLAEKK